VKILDYQGSCLLVHAGKEKTTAQFSFIGGSHQRSSFRFQLVGGNHVISNIHFLENIGHNNLIFSQAKLNLQDILVE